MSLELITNINSAILFLFCALSAYQYIYIIVSVLFRPCRYENRAGHHNRYAVLICARNEEAVIGQLIDSIKKQDYPAELLDIYVLADNCHDNTKGVATGAGAVVYERQNDKQVGKGYALNHLLHIICAEKGDEYYNAYFVFDADNLLAGDYVSQMDRVFSNGYRVVTSYRNSKNFCRSWVSAGYGVLFLREARHMNNARMILHSSCAISGTGFMVHRDIINEKGGWPYHTLTEDIEFTVERIISGEKIGYCHDAVFYDEQPITFRQSCRQRLRWAKGCLQVVMKYGARMVLGIFRKKSGFSCFDEIMTTLPSLILPLFAVVSLGSMVYSAFLYVEGGFVRFLAAFGGYLLGVYGINFFLGLITTITEWKKIAGPAYKKIFYVFTYPIFMISNVPLVLLSLFMKVGWKEVKHSDARGIDQIGA